jgi:serine/threonine-protein kinase
VEADTVDRYVLGPELGRGGMGRVHQAWDPVLKRVVALKLLHGQDPEMHLRLLREARTQARLDHPGICRIHDLGQAEGHPYIAMQLVLGKSLSELRPELDFPAMAAVMADVAAAIQAAHHAGLIHRDLKPANILVARRGDGSLQPVVVDFGLARDLTLLDQTLSWAVMGTPAFMSPEQTLGEALGPATDLYSLGATLYALLSGQPPYESATLAGLVTNQVACGVRAVRRLNPAVPRDLETITLKCLEREPTKRYATARALEEDLRRFLAGEPILARPVGPLGRIWRWAKRRPTLAATGAAGLLIALLLLGWNGHIRSTSRARERAAQRFGLEIRDAEHLLRIERMMPIHDIRPAEARLRKRMDTIRSEMGHLGRSAQGPGLYALGRGHLALRDYPEAARHLEAAWQAGFQAPEVAFGLGLTLLKQFEELKLQSYSRHEPAEARQKLRSDRVPLALGWMARAAGASVDHAEYGAGLVAAAEGLRAEADRHFALALEQAPWLYEAWVSRALNEQESTFTTSYKGSTEQIHATFQRCLTFVREAEQLAPSDEEALLFHANALVSEAIARAARDARKTQPILEAHRLLEQGLRINPNSERIQGFLPGTALQLGFLMLSSGGDPAALTRQAAERMESMASRETWPREGDWHNAKSTLHHLWWVVADADQRFGRNPDGALAHAKHWRDQVPPDVHHVFTWLIEAKAMVDRGQDPRAGFKRAMDLLDSLKDQPQWKDLVFFNSTFGQALLEQGDWEWRTTRGGAASLKLAVGLLEANRTRNPQFAYTFYHLPRVHALLARMALTAGQDPKPHVQAAVLAGKQGQAINPDNANLQLAAADAHLADGQVRAGVGEDPAPAWAACRTDLAAAEKANGRDYRMKLLRAELELAVAKTLSDPKPHLEAAKAACRVGLSLKKDEPEFRRILTRIADF